MWYFLVPELDLKELLVGHYLEFDYHIQQNLCIRDFSAFTIVFTFCVQFYDFTVEVFSLIGNHFEFPTGVNRVPGGVLLIELVFFVLGL